MEERPAGQTAKAADGNQYDANGQPITDYMAKYDMSQADYTKMKDKFKKEKGDFVQPTTDAEKEYVLDQIIAQLLEVKNGQWGKPVKLD